MERDTGLWVPADTEATHYSTGHHAWQLVEHERYLEINDPAFGERVIAERPEAPLLRELMMTPLAIRATAIAQLSKDKEHATIPNTYDFHTFGHVETNAALVKEFCKLHPGDVTDEQRLSWQLVVFLDDLAHGPGRHLTDMIIEGGFGGSENFHQLRAKEAWQYGGIQDILDKHGLRVNATGALVGVRTPRWVETPAPDISIERFQYTVEEMRLWLESAHMTDQERAVLNNLSSLDNLTITQNGRLAFKDEEAALLFSKAYLLLSTEHWNEPVHRVVEHLLIEAFKHNVYSRRLPEMEAYDRGETADVASYTYGIDQDLKEAFRTTPHNRDDAMFAISGLLRHLSEEERDRFTQYKKSQFVRFLIDPRAEDYPSAILNGHAFDAGHKSSVVETEITLGKASRTRKPAIKANAAKLIHTDSGGVQYALQPMKNRYVDPLVMTPRGPRRLSEVNSRYNQLLRQHAVIHASKIAVRLAISRDYEQLIQEVVVDNIEQAQKERPKLKRDQLRWQIEAAVGRARELAQATDHLVLREAA